MCQIEYCDPWKVYRATTRTARTPHQCYECHRTIVPGERYHYATGLHPDSPRWDVFRLCPHCDAASQWLVVVCSGFQTDRIRCVHDLVAHWYRGRWDGIYHQVPVTMDATKRTVHRKPGGTSHTGYIDSSSYATEDGGPRLLTSVVHARSMHGRAIHPTEKPVGLLLPLIEYAVPSGGVLVDPMSGSCSSALAARLTGRRAVCVERREDYLEAAARRLDQGVLEEAAP